MFTKKTRNTEHSADKKIKYLFGEEEASDIEKRFFGFCPHNDLVKAKAFTLAEVLITLGIIGIVAAMTIPAIINKQNDLANKIALKENFSQLSNVFSLVLNENSGSFDGVCAGATCIKNSFLGKSKYIKDCVSVLTDGCWHQPYEWYNLNSNTGCGKYAGSLTNCPGKSLGGPGYVLENGSLLHFQWLSSNCQYKIFTPSYGVCGSILIDVNGFKQPNTIGKDIFAFWIRNDRLSPLGVQDESPSFNCTTVGWRCTAEIILNRK